MCETRAGFFIVAEMDSGLDVKRSKWGGGWTDKDYIYQWIDGVFRVVGYLRRKSKYTMERRKVGRVG